MAMDRKRRLTASNNDGGRRRYIPDNLQERDDMFTQSNQDTPSSSTRPLPRQRRSTPSQIPASAEIIDLTNSPPAPTTVSIANNRISMPTNPRGYTLPHWQPDSEVSECPICKRRFGLFFRRHHCRKCGRVVCNDCSPHRITIPRQFIVNPPGLDHTSSSPVQTMDLTGRGDDGDDEPASIFANHHIQQSFSNSGIGGGEKVRLCNPCVPDPQPEPRVAYTSSNIAGLPELPRFGAARDLPTFARPRHSIAPRDLIQVSSCRLILFDHVLS